MYAGKGKAKVLSINISLKKRPCEVVFRFCQYCSDKPQAFTKPIRYGWQVDLEE